MYKDDDDISNGESSGSDFDDDEDPDKIEVPGIYLNDITKSENKS